MNGYKVANDTARSKVMLADWSKMFKKKKNGIKTE